MDKLKKKNKKAKNKTVFDDNDLSEENIGNNIKDEDNNLEKDIDNEKSENNEIPPVKKKIKKKKNTDETRNKKILILILLILIKMMIITMNIKRNSQNLF